VKPGVSTGQQADLRRLKREVADSRRAEEILKSAAASFAAELDRPTTRWFATSMRSGIWPTSDRAIRDRFLGEEIACLHAENYQQALRGRAPDRCRDPPSQPPRAGSAEVPKVSDPCDFRPSVWWAGP